MNAVGTVLRERYEIIAEIGKGGMSTVYLAKDKNLGSYWAVKQVKNDKNVDIEAFKKEVELLSSLSHSDIPRIVDRIDAGEDFFVVMDFIDGTSLGKKVMNEGPIKENDVVEWAKMLCDVLEYLHTAKDNPIIYRDMKPDNIMLTQSGRVKLIDFGIAKECRRGQNETGASVGTKGYAAPEQYRGASNILDERTDIYSLGATLFFLVTGIAPMKPPKGIRPIRQINPLLSEGLEYIIAKCTDDAPENRYQNCRELKEDLKNINQLTSVYRRRMSRKLAAFSTALVASLLFLIMTFIGYSGMQKENEDNYQYYYKLAYNDNKSNDLASAAENYVKAIECKPDNIEAYILYFNILLPQSGDEEFIDKTKDAIDIMRNTYLDNTKSDMYENKDLMYLVVKRCIEVNDSTYASYAVNYIDILKDKKFSADDLDSYEIIASNCAKNLATQDFEAFNLALLNLEKTTDNVKMTANDKLSNYYSIMVMYSGYPTYLDDAYTRIYEIGSEAKAIIDSNLQIEDLTFNNIIPMYELIASSLYNNAITLSDSLEKEKQYKLSIEWFGYLDDLNDNLSENLSIKKGNAYKGIFDIYNTANNRKNMNDTIKAYLDKSIVVYQNIIDKNNSSFLSYIYITQAYLDKEMIKSSAAERDFTTVNRYYARIVELKNSDKNLSNIALSQFSSLKQSVINAGLEG
ncbi:serine/threonine-protein kinase [[Clostridium] fimetarium]|uniref:non-specific serine/threonine protein kinase n=1 Tax=[Clostridium] fimetarium TaxID=99656 RepID=A0A1I0PFD4_9FIRM|nr:serine/threonine-protein kinase [[Clostridium] fimetarium]SEW12966.1 serine/threonine protein kinase [[Clostridium] fimetarium]